jgi:hypothetical protein
MCPNPRRKVYQYTPITPNFKLFPNFENFACLARGNFCARYDGGGPLLGVCGPVLCGPVLGGRVLGGPVLGGPVLGGPLLGGPVLGGPVLGGPVNALGAIGEAATGTAAPGGLATAGVVGVDAGVPGAIPAVSMGAGPNASASFSLRLIEICRPLAAP